MCGEIKINFNPCQLKLLHDIDDIDNENSSEISQPLKVIKIVLQFLSRSD